ncbi:MAG: hypothetical protein NTW59_04650, partial [Candidatus Diapherotrites archaeon]|nr:hypothetical protein [Candidatus Diapherotrites archaeon]
MDSGLFFLLDPTWWQALGGFVFSEFGLLGLFFFSIIGNATIFLPVPVDIVVLIISPLAANPLMALLIGIVSGVGAAIGELSGYFIGVLGIKGYEKATKKEVLSVADIQAKIKDKGAWV